MAANSNLDLDITWLSPVEGAFLKKGIAGEDFFYLLMTMIKEENYTFLELLCKAAQGYGCTIHEGLSYSLDQDWDNPDMFDGVSICIGEIESSILSIDDYIQLIKMAANEYICLVKGEGEIISKYINEIEIRYDVSRQ